MKQTNTLLIAVLVFGLTACSSTVLESKKIDYKSSGKQTVSTLEVPPDLTMPTTSDRYAVSETSPGGVATFSGYRHDRETQSNDASSGYVLASVDKMRIERAGSQRWLVIKSSADKLWPDIKDFWVELGFIINIEQPAVGIMETDWAENRARIPQDLIRKTVGWLLDSLYSVPERDKFRTRLEEGKEAGTVEVYISHRGMVEDFADASKNTTVWKPRAADPELETEMLRRLMVRLGAEEQRATELLTTEQSQDSRASLNSAGEDGKWVLQVHESFDRAWRRVGLALDRIGFTVEDRDRSQGLYFVRYVDPDVDARSSQSGGFLSKLAFWRSGDKVAAAGSEYRIRVSETERNESQLSVLSKDGVEIHSETARRMLALLEQQLK